MKRQHRSVSGLKTLYKHKYGIHSILPIATTSFPWCCRGDSLPWCLASSLEDPRMHLRAMEQEHGDTQNPNECISQYSAHGQGGEDKKGGEGDLNLILPFTFKHLQNLRASCPNDHLVSRPNTCHMESAHRTSRKHPATSVKHSMSNN